MREVLIGAHWHNDSTAGLEAACECGVILLAICDSEALITLSELNSLARNHEEKMHEAH